MMISVKINLDKIDKETDIYVGEKGKYLSFTIGDRKEPDSYGNTHSVWIKPKDGEKKYIGEGKLIGEKQAAPPITDVEPNDLPW